MVFLRCLLCVLMVSSCAPERPALSEDQERVLLTRSRQAADELMSKLKGQLKAALKAEGPVGAVNTCSVIAPAIAQQVSQEHQLSIYRVSHKNRNPQGAPDSFESEALQKWETQPPKAGAKEEFYGVSMNKGEPVFRYVRGIRIQKACLQCHGTNVTPQVKAAIASHYPADQAVGYELNDLRGAVSSSISLSKNPKKGLNHEFH